MENQYSIAVIGAGTMGHGIAQVCALARVPVVILDINDSALERGLNSIKSNMSRLVSKGKLTETEQNNAIQRITTSLDYSVLNTANLIVEAATESLELKKTLLKKIEQNTTATAVIATNTSSISITSLAAILEKPERFIGIHFFNPVPMMPLIEVIRAKQSSDSTYQKAIGFAMAIGKSPISVQNSPGFVVNRILCPMINEAIFALQEGLASAEDIDTGMRLGCNHPIGPLALGDLIGLDTLLAVMQILHAELGDPKYRPAPMLREMVAAGYLGRKSGRGFYEYKNK